MNGEGKGNTAQDEPNAANSAQPPYNPLASHETGNSTIGNNVVRDLMRVYESLTQSSTPQVPEENGPGGSSAHKHDPIPSWHQEPPQHQPQISASLAYPQHGLPQHGSAAPMQLASYTMPQNVPYPPPHQAHYPPPPTQPPSNTAPYYGDPSYTIHQAPYMVPPPEHQAIHCYTAPVEHPPAQAHEEEEGNDSEAPAEATGRGRRKRRGSDSSGTRGGKGRKKSKSADGRWSKRFTWPEDLHRDFVSAIFDVGLKHSSPSTILEHMPEHEQITTERIKSHLQKYRMHRQKSKKEFISSYESSLHNFQSRGIRDIKSISGGEVAAHLSYAAIDDGKGGQAGPAEVAQSASTQDGTSNKPRTPGQPNNTLTLPQLTEAEKQSPMGASMGYLMGLFFSLKQQLMIQRAMEAGATDKAKVNAPVRDAFNSFVSGNAPAAATPSISAADCSGELQQSLDNGTKSAGPVLSAPSVRNNIEENSMMKREMQNQMALQNKMRALKQQELNKYKKSAASLLDGKETALAAAGFQPHSPTKDMEDPSKIAEAASHIQGAGEPGGNDGAVGNRNRGLSIGASEEFWNTDVVDEQLFEFLMNN